MRSRNVFAVRKSAETPGWLCGMVMPLSFNPAQGVTLIRRTCRVRAEPLAEFLLNPGLCPLRLHIQVHANQNEDRHPQDRPERDQQNAAQFFHAGTLRRSQFEEKTKARAPGLLP